MPTTRSNPYSPPTPLVTDGRADGGTASSWLAALLGAQVLVSAFRIALYAQAFAGWDLLPRAGTWVETASRVSWLASLVLLAPTLVAYSVWIAGANRAARAIAAGALEFTPGWCVAASFVPVVQLIAPYRAVDEIRAVIAPWAGLAVRLWWGLFVASLAFGLLSRLSLSAGAAVWRAPVHDALWAASALGLLAVVRAFRQGFERRSDSPRAAA